jgi:hypothetical protein
MGSFLSSREIGYIKISIDIIRIKYLLAFILGKSHKNAPGAPHHVMVRGIDRKEIFTGP